MSERKYEIGEVKKYLNLSEYLIVSETRLYHKLLRDLYEHEPSYKYQKYSILVQYDERISYLENSEKKSFEKGILISYDEVELWHSLA